MQYFEDVVVGNRVEGAETFTLTAQEIKAFAGDWDPMPFHLDEDLAAQSPIGKLFASSIHTVAIAVRLSHAMKQEEMAVVAGLGWDEVRFHQPVCAGDELRVRAEVVSKRESTSKPDRGICVSQLTLVNTAEEPLVSLKIASLVLKRDVAGA